MSAPSYFWLLVGIGFLLGSYAERLKLRMGEADRWAKHVKDLERSGASRGTLFWARLSRDIAIGERDAKKFRSVPTWFAFLLIGGAIVIWQLVALLTTRSNGAA